MAKKIVTHHKVVKNYNNVKTPKGFLIAIGGGEDKEGDREILREVLNLARRRKPNVEIITTATNLPKEVGKDYKVAFEGLSANLRVMNVTSRKEAEKAEFLERIAKCDAVFFSGGNQLKLTTVLGGTELLKTIKDKYWTESKFVVAGTSAGAAAMSSTMIVSGSSQDALIKGELQLHNGLDFISSIFIDTHFTQRGRFGRLMQTITANPAILGVGLGEDTGIIIEKGTTMRVVGSGLVGIVDGINITYTDLTEVRDGDPIAIEGLTMHVLKRGNVFDITTRKFFTE